MTPEQCLAARRLLDWNQQRLGHRAGSSSTSVLNFESRRRPVSSELVARLRTTLEDAGIEFTDSEEPGVQLRKDRATA